MNQVKISHNVIWTLPFFSGLNEREKTELLRVANFRHFERGEIIFLQGDAVTHLYWICEGAVQVFRGTPDGRELTGAIRMTDDLLYEPDALHLKKNHAMNARVVKDATLLTIPVTWIDEHMHSCDHMMNHFITILAQRAQEARIESEHQATMNAAQIINCFLQHLCILHNFDPNGFDLPYTKSLIASRLGMELESLSRALPKLKEMGITVNGKHVSFDNIGSIQRHSCGVCSSAEDCPTSTALRINEQAEEQPRKTEIAS
jgi:CRP-like cAMP-binding protein